MYGNTPFCSRSLNTFTKYAGFDLEVIPLIHSFHLHIHASLRAERIQYRKDQSQISVDN